MIKVLKNLLQLLIDDIEAANYIGVCRATFDNYIKNGLIPKGRKRLGFKELSWNKSDLDKFLRMS